jgi:hypothetical protein
VNWSAPAPSAQARIPEGAQTFVSTFDDGSLSMGNLELEATALVAASTADSRNLAQAIVAIAQGVAGPLLRRGA